MLLGRPVTGRGHLEVHFRLRLRLPRRGSLEVDFRPVAEAQVRPPLDWRIAGAVYADLVNCFTSEQLVAAGKPAGRPNLTDFSL